MAVPSSGELKLWDDIWNNEIGGTQGNNSLHSASVYAGFSTPDAMSDFYGWSDIELPSVVTTDITAPYYNCVCLFGCISNTGNSTALTRGFYVGTAANPYTSNSKVQISGTQSTTGAFSCKLTGRSQGTRYYAWAWAANEVGEVVGGRDCTITPYPPFTPVMRDLKFGRNDSSNWGPEGPATSQIGYINPYSSGFAVQSSAATPSGGICHVYCPSAENTLNRRLVIMSNSTANPYSDVGVLTCRATSTCQYNIGGSGIAPGPSGFVSAGSQGPCRVLWRSLWYPSQGSYGCINGTYCYCYNSDIRLKTNINYL